MTTDTPASAPVKTFLRIPFNEWKRKAVHMGSFAGAFALPYLTPKRAALMAIGALLFNMFVLPKLMPSIIRREGNSGYLDILMYPAAVLAMILGLEGTHPEGIPFVIGCWFALAFGDGLFGLAHKYFATDPKVPWNERKTWTGMLAGVLLVSLAVAGMLIGGDYYNLPRGRLTLSVFAAVLPLAMTLGIVESIWFGIVDNLTIPFFAITTITLLHTNPLSRLHELKWWLVVPVLFSLLAYAAGKVTRGGMLLGGWIALLLVSGVPQLFLFFAGFFALGVLSTRYGAAEKKRRAIEEARGGRRGCAEIFGAGGVMAMLIALPILRLGATGATIVSSARHLLIVISPLIAKTMDTVSSEMGKAIGGKTISLRSFRAVAPGTDGGVSLAGTLWGLAAAASLAALILPLHWGGLKEVGVLVGIAILANLFESYWAAWAGPRGVDDGPHTNFMMTLFAATLAWFWWM